MLKSWSIQNFKAIVDSGNLKLAPVTVLAGIVIQPTEYSLRWQGLMRDEMSLLLAKTCAYKHIGFAFTNELYIATLAFKCVNKEIVISTRF